MKTTSKFNTVYLFFLFIFLSTSLFGVHSVKKTIDPTQKLLNQLNEQPPHSLKWGERIALRILKKKLKKKIRQQQKIAKKKKANQTIKRKKNGFGLVAFAAALIGVSLTITGSGWFFLFALIAVIVGGIGMSRAKRKPEEYTGRGLALAGFIIGCVNILLPLLLILILLFTIVE